MSDNNNCIICLGKNPITPDNPLTKEHIVPEFMGGTLMASNVCKTCNSNMGDGFEGRLANSRFFKLAVDSYRIKGKKGQVYNSLSGTYDHNGKKIRIKHDGELATFPGVTVSELEDGTLNIEVEIDAKDEKDTPTLVFKGIKRFYRNKGVDVLDADIEKMVGSMQAGKRVKSKIENPELKFEMVIDYSDLNLLFSKIVYELAVYHFGEGYIKNKLGNKLRLALMNQNADNVRPPVNNDLFEKVFNNESHWVVFFGKECYIRTFTLSGIVEYSTGTDGFEVPDGVVYKFDFINGGYSVRGLQDYLHRHPK